MKTQGEKKIVLVTGGCGYIGSHTILELIRQTDFVPVSIDNLANSYGGTVDRIKQISGKEVKNHEIDICDRDVLRNTLAQYKGQIAGVIHFAALKSVPDSVKTPLS